MVRDGWVNLAIRPETRELVREQKRGGDSYDDVLRKMVKQYDPEAASQAVERNA